MWRSIPSAGRVRYRRLLKMLQSLAEWVPDATTRRNILQNTPTRLFAFA
jgi:hypothetical protein